MLVNDELEKLYQEAVVTYLKVVTQQCCEVTEESNKDSVSVAGVSISTGHLQSTGKKCYTQPTCFYAPLINF
jgi:hypothetical protein